MAHELTEDEWREIARGTMRDIRVSLGWTAVAFGEALGMSGCVIANKESGRTPWRQIEVEGAFIAIRRAVAQDRAAQDAELDQAQIALHGFIEGGH